MPNQQPNQQFNQPYHPIIPSPKPKINLKYILIVAILAFLVGGGILAYQYWWLPRHEIKPPELMVKDQTANWQTYRNEEYGFEFKYSPKWEKLNSIGSEIIRIRLKEQYAGDDPKLNPEGDYDFFMVREEPALLSKYKNLTSFKNALQAVEKKNEYAKLIINESLSINFWDVVNENSFNSIPALVVQVEDPFGGTPEPTMYIFNDGKFLSISYSFGPEGVKEGLQILSTFKFIEKADTSNWQTYRNEEYGFEVKYPQGWVIEEKDELLGEVPTKEFSLHKIGEDPRNEKVAHITILPKGFTTGLPNAVNIDRQEIYFAGRKADTIRFLTEKGDVWWQMISGISNLPSDWGINSYIIISPNITNLRSECAVQVPPGGECGLEDGQKFFGDIDQNDWKQLNQIISTFKFIK